MVFGGHTKGWQIPSPAVSLKDVWAFNLTTNVWGQITVQVGGWAGVPLKDVWAFNLTTNVWGQITVQVGGWVGGWVLS